MNNELKEYHDLFVKPCLRILMNAPGQIGQMRKIEQAYLKKMLEQEEKDLELEKELADIANEDLR